jgi:hypothetical protein
MGTFSNNPQGFRTPGGRAGTAVFVEVEGVRELNNRFRQLSRAVVTPREKQKIAQMGAMPIVAAAKKLVKVANKDFPFYFRRSKIHHQAGEPARFDNVF